MRAQEPVNERMRRGRAKRDLRVKMGHGGTLDPLATGVLILGVGSGTKALQSFLDCTKVYETVVLFGASTDSYDRVGRILTKRPYEDITRKMVEDALDDFRGKIKQIPPIYSALKMDGKKLYEYAREGKQPPREVLARDVEVLELELVEWYEPGAHNHRWPTEEAEAFERNFAEQLWRNQKNQVNAKQLTAEERQEEKKALEEHESFKKEFEERQDSLITDNKNPKKRQRSQVEPVVMSGALGTMPPTTRKFSNLLPPSPPPGTPPPWTDKGPPAAKIRMTVTSGFYVRSFCHDLGMKIGSAAMMAELVRGRQGDFSIGGPNCLEHEDLTAGEEVWGPKVQQMLLNWMAKTPTPHSSGSLQGGHGQQRERPPRHERNDKRKASGASSSGRPQAKRRRNSSSESEAEASLPVAKRAELEKTAEPAADETALADESRSDAKSEASWNGIKD